MGNTGRFGEPLKGWTPPPLPETALLEGRYARVERLEPERHGVELYRALCEDKAGAIWDYMSYGPFGSLAAYHRWLREAAGQDDTVFHAIRDKATGQAAGVASYLRIKPAEGTIEIGHICFAPALQRTRAATEAMYLMMRAAFEAGFRRFEWKCDALNIASRRAAERLGLSYEGVFRQATIVKGRNRDTAWFAAIDKDWPALKAAFEAWLVPENFDHLGRQAERLSDLTRLVRVAHDPALHMRA